eukprot:511450-Rhodomonas_salina.1
MFRVHSTRSFLGLIVPWLILLVQLRSTASFHGQTLTALLGQPMGLRKSGADSICVAGRRAASKLALRDASDAASDTRVKVLERELQKTRQELEDTKKTLREVRSGGDPDMESIGIAEMADLWSVIASLTANPMSEGGCPWTAEQGALDIIQVTAFPLHPVPPVPPSCPPLPPLPPHPVHPQCLSSTRSHPKSRRLDIVPPGCGSSFQLRCPPTQALTPFCLQHARSELEEIADELKLGSSSAHNALQSELGDMLFNTLLLIR